MGSIPSLELVLGGIGLLLLGMGLLTDGLKLAAGGSLHYWLQRSTSTRSKALFAGFSLTAIVQSSSAVTMATIGFANAGLLGLESAAWLVFGSNVGTTVTGWLVSLIGLDFKIEAFAMPLIGLGILVRMFRPDDRLGALAGAVAGFGVLFLGLSFLKDAFSDIGDSVSQIAVEDVGLMGLVYGVAIGAAMTAVMQSSSAAIAIVFTAFSQGLVGEAIGAAMVIGANVGTTSTALLASVNATANARRLALMHVFFNVQTALVACVLLAPLLWVTGQLRSMFGLDTDSAVTLALFHTVFNIVGVILMWPLSERISRWVAQRFRKQEAQTFQPKYLDQTALALPATGVRAAFLELHRAAGELSNNAEAILSGGSAQSISRRLDDIQRLLDQIADFLSRLNESKVTSELGQAIIRLLASVVRYRSVRLSLADLLGQLSAVNQDLTLLPDRMGEAIHRVIRHGNPADDGFSAKATRRYSKAFHQLRREQRKEILQQTADGQSDMTRAAATLQLFAILAQLSSQLSKATLEMDEVSRLLTVEDAELPVPAVDSEDSAVADPAPEASPEVSR